MTATFLMLLLSGCANRIDDTQSTQVIVQLPPPGMLSPCNKPQVQGTWPEVVTDDIPRMKKALTECNQQIEDYLKWRAQREQPTERETP